VYFGFDDDQLALRDAVAGLLEKRAGLTVLQQAWADPTSDAVWSVWKDLAEMGVQGLMAPEATGGSGMDWVTMALVLAEAGRAALPLPLLETAAVGIPILVAAGDPAGMIPSLVDGSAVLSVRGGAADEALTPASSRANWFLLGSTLYHRDEVRIEAVQSVDRTRDTAVVSPVGPGVTVGDPSGSGALATAAMLVGLGRALVQMTVDYVKDRHQFGVPIGSFQAIKHHLADATMHVEFAAPAVWAAAWETDHAEAVGTERVSRSVSLAKAMATDAAEQAARIALQCHGAMGYTDDYHLHFWLKRVWCLAPSFGSARQHRIRVGSQLGLSR
jgi:alkylation response protein AidB-like acyl-CoA dehydrogenase